MKVPTEEESTRQLLFESLDKTIRRTTAALGKLTPAELSELC